MGALKYLAPRLIQATPKVASHHVRAQQTSEGLQASIAHHAPRHIKRHVVRLALVHLDHASTAAIWVCPLAILVLLPDVVVVCREETSHRIQGALIWRDVSEEKLNASSFLDHRRQHARTEALVRWVGAIDLIVFVVVEVCDDAEVKVDG